MQHINTLIGLLGKTQSRDKILRVFQYATLHSLDQTPKGTAHNIYVQMRRTRKILRFLRTLEYSTAIKKEIKTFGKEEENPYEKVRKILSILENLFTLLFFIFDHRVFLGELEVIDKSNAVTSYPRSMKCYLLQNIFAAVKNLVDIAIIFLEGKYQGQFVDMDNFPQLLRQRAFAIIKHILDCLVAVFYLTMPKGSAGKVGILGVITSIMGICQSLKVI